MRREEPQLVHAALLGNEEMVRSLVGKGIDVNQPSPSTGLTPLLAALMTEPNQTNYSQKVSVARLLLRKGANPNAKDDKGHTALWYAVSFQKNLVIVRLLLQKGATNWNDDDAEGDSALAAARSLDLKEVTTLLEDADQKWKTTLQEVQNPK